MEGGGLSAFSTVPHGSHLMNTHYITMNVPLQQQQQQGMNDSNGTTASYITMPGMPQRPLPQQQHQQQQQQYFAGMSAVPPPSPSSLHPSSYVPMAAAPGEADFGFAKMISPQQQQQQQQPQYQTMRTTMAQGGGVYDATMATTAAMMEHIIPNPNSNGFENVQLPSPQQQQQQGRPSMFTATGTPFHSAMSSPRSSVGGFMAPLLTHAPVMPYSTSSTFHHSPAPAAVSSASAATARLGAIPGEHAVMNSAYVGCVGGEGGATSFSPATHMWAHVVPVSNPTIPAIQSQPPQQQQQQYRMHMSTQQDGEPERLSTDSSSSATTGGAAGASATSMASDSGALAQQMAAYTRTIEELQAENMPHATDASNNSGMNLSSEGREYINSVLAGIQKLCGSCASAEEGVAQSERVFVQVAALENHLMSLLQQASLMQSQGNIKEGGGYSNNSSAQPSLTNSPSRRGAAATADSNNTNNNNGKGSQVRGTQRLLADLESCAKLIDDIAKVEVTLSPLEAQYRDLQRRYILLNEADTIFDTIAGLTPVVSARTSTQLKELPTVSTLPTLALLSSSSEQPGDDINKASGGTNATGNAALQVQQQLTELEGSARGAKDYLRDVLHARHVAIRDRLMDDLLLQRDDIALEAVAPSSQFTTAEVREGYPRTMPLLLVSVPCQEDDDSDGKENNVIKTTTPKTGLVSSNLDTPVTPSIKPHQQQKEGQLMMTVIASPARYAEMQLYEAAHARLEAMKRRVCVLREGREAELRRLEHQVASLDAYDPEVDVLAERRRRAANDTATFSAWEERLMELSERLECMRRVMHVALRDSAAVRRQLLEVLEQRLSEEEKFMAAGDGDVVGGSVTPRVSVRMSDVTAAPPPPTARRSTQQPQLPRASAVFLEMLAKIASKEGYFNGSDDGPEAPALLSAEEVMPVDASADKTRQKSIRSTAVFTSSEVAAPTATPLSEEALAQEKGQGMAPGKTRRRGREEMEEKPLVAPPVPGESSSNSNKRAITATALIPADSGNVEDEDDALYAFPELFKEAREASVSSSTCTEQNQDDNGREEEEDKDVALPGRDGDRDRPSRREYSLRNGNILGGIAAFAKAMVKRAVVFPSDEDEGESEEDEGERRGGKRRRVEQR